MNSFDRCIVKLDQIKAQLDKNRLYTASMIWTIWGAMFFVPATVLIGSIIWLSQH
jgi:hypothetical protein